MIYMKRKSTLHLILTLAGLVGAILGAYAFARFLNPGPFVAPPRFSTTYHEAGISIPFPGSEANVVATLSGGIHSFAVSPDLRTIAIATSTEVVLYDLQSYEQLRTLDSEENSFSVAFSLDGEKLAAGSLIM